MVLNLIVGYLSVNRMTRVSISLKAGLLVLMLFASAAFARSPDAEAQREIQRMSEAEREALRSYLHQHREMSERRRREKNGEGLRHQPDATPNTTPEPPALRRLSDEERRALRRAMREAYPK